VFFSQELPPLNNFLWGRLLKSPPRRSFVRSQDLGALSLLWTLRGAATPDVRVASERVASLSVQEEGKLPDSLFGREISKGGRSSNWGINRGGGVDFWDPPFWGGRYSEASLTKGGVLQGGRVGHHGQKYSRGGVNMSHAGLKNFLYHV